MRDQQVFFEKFKENKVPIEIPPEYVLILRSVIESHKVSAKAKSLYARYKCGYIEWDDIAVKFQNQILSVISYEEVIR